MPRHIACLTFDFDAMSGMIAWGLTSPTPISRGEFGAIGVGRILALLGEVRHQGDLLHSGHGDRHLPASLREDRRGRT